MGLRLVIDRLSEGSVPPATEGPREVAPPTLADIRMVFGVGARADTPPTAEDFKPVYRVSMPVFSLGGLDPDGVHEFDAAALLRDLQTRAQRRRWAFRLEIDVVQPAQTVACADLHVETPVTDPDGPRLEIVGRTGRGTTLPGGGRSVTVASSLVHDAQGANTLAGTYVFEIRDTDPSRDTPPPRVSSAPRSLTLALSNYEFQD